MPCGFASHPRPACVECSKPIEPAVLKEVPPVRVVEGIHLLPRGWRIGPQPSRNGGCRVPDEKPSERQYNNYGRALGQLVAPFGGKSLHGKPRKPGTQPNFPLSANRLISLNECTRPRNSWRSFLPFSLRLFTDVTSAVHAGPHLSAGNPRR